MPLLEGKGVTRHFGGLAAVHNVDFDIGEGEIVGLIGPNGAGKTTLFNLISGALPLTSGIITFRGANITRMRAYEICRMGVARTFQAGKLFPKMTVYENVLSGVLFGRSRTMPTSDGHRDAEELLDLVELAEKRGVLAQDLTLAAQKRLEIARALGTKPEVLLLDEVMAGLTPTEVGHSLELIKEIRGRGVTVFLIEHVMKAIMGISERVIVLHHGEKIAEGRPEDIVKSRTVISIYLGD
jgi:branched-chain amino acid transport system ATP-binding protein